MAEKEKKDNVLSAGKESSWWTKEIAKSWKDWDKPRDRGRAVVKRYLDEREQAETSKRFNILFSNTETLKPAVYSQVPTPDIRRRYQDKDVVGRYAATILQRATGFCIESYDFHSVLKRARDDYLLPGFAVARVVYKPYLKSEEVKDGEGKAVMGDDQKPKMSERVVYQEVKTEYVPWDMFTMSRSKTYERVWWAAVAEDLTRDEVKAQFGQATAEKLNFGLKGDEGDEEADGKVRVWEVWCKRSRSRFVVAEGYDGWVKDPEQDPLRLENFYPWPKPLWSVTTNSTLCPRPEFLQYQDQADELDDLTERIDVLTSAIRRRGVFDDAHKEMFDMLTGLGDNQFVGVTDWATLMSKGGLENAAMEMPFDGLIKAVVALEDRRERVKQTIYEVTGISDIVRGATNPNETATAQQTKSRWAGLRISSRQSDFAVFARDLVRLKAEIIAERYSPETLSMVSGIKLPMQAQKQQWTALQAQQQQIMQQYQAIAQQAQQAGQQPPPSPQIQQPSPEDIKFYGQPTWEEVIKVLRDDKLRGFKIDIETDSTVQPDADAEQKARTDFIVAVGNSAQQLAGAVQVGFIDQAVARELWQFGLRSFKSSPALEEALDAARGQEAGGMSPAQAQQQQQQLAQQQQELQKRAAEVVKREEAAKSAEHAAELQGKDLKNQSDALAADRKLFALEQKVATELDALQAAHTQQLQEVGKHAETAVQTVLQEALAQVPLPQAQAESAAEPKAKGSSSGLRDIHIHTGGDKGAPDGKKKPRRLRIADQEDGSMLAEEVLDEITDAAPAVGA